MEVMIVKNDYAVEMILITVEIMVGSFFNKVRVQKNRMEYFVNVKLDTKEIYVTKLHVKELILVVVMVCIQ